MAGIQEFLRGGMKQLKEGTVLAQHNIKGTFAIAPFLGDRKLIEEIAAAGSLEQWRAPPRADTMDADNYQRELWRWLER